MCFFVAQFAKVSQLRTRYWNSVLKDTSAFMARYVANGFEHPHLMMVRDSPEPTIESAQWGLIPAWCRSEEEAKQLANLTLNAKGETMFEKPSFSESAHHQRCLLPVNGFFEYQHNGKQKTPYFISLKDAPIFSLGGLYSEWLNSRTGAVIKTFSIVTTAANPLMETIHNSKKRMPLIIPTPYEKAWLSSTTSAKEVGNIIAPFADATMQAWPVAPLIQNRRVSNTPSAVDSIARNLLF